MRISEQEFYDRLAIFFDVMTDWPSRLAYELPFLQRMLEGTGRRVLDAACGTGWHSIALAEVGYRVTGVDISPHMVARAQANAQRRGVDVSFVQAAFHELPLVVGVGFDAVLCLGNSLAHVLTENDLRLSLSGMAGSLRPGGILLLHNLNYDKRLVEKPRWFPVNSGMMDGQEMLVWRFADYGQDLIIFNVAIFQKDDTGHWTVQVQSTPQRPWLASELVAMLRETGFNNIELFGNLAGDPYEARESGDLVLVARHSKT